MPGPRQVLLLRHAEKPEDHQNPHLSAQGFARAAALPLLFVPGLPCSPQALDAPRTFALKYDDALPGTKSTLPRPECLIATKQVKISNRPLETITPLAAALGLAISAGHEDEEFETVAQHVLNHERFGDKVVLICWHHEKLPKLAAALGAKAVPEWPDSVFDRVWHLDYSSTPVRFSNLPQRLLFGDTSA
jgi:hypothetical protein